jgi:hypothetical protein
MTCFAVKAPRVRGPSGVLRDPKHRVQRSDAAQLLVWRIGADTLDERADLPGPLLQMGAEERQLLLVGELGGGELLRTRSAQVSAA